MLESLFILLIILNVFDFYSTYKILKAGGIEVNPAMNFLIKKLGLITALILSKLIVLVSIVILFYMEMQVLMIVLGLFYLYVAINNFRQMVIKNKNSNKSLGE